MIVSADQVAPTDLTTASPDPGPPPPAHSAFLIFCSVDGGAVASLSHLSRLSDSHSVIIYHHGDHRSGTSHAHLTTLAPYPL